MLKKIVITRVFLMNKFLLNRFLKKKEFLTMNLLIESPMNPLLLN